MKPKTDKKFQMIGFIEDAETSRVSVVEHGANRTPFTMLKAEDMVDQPEAVKEPEINEAEMLKKAIAKPVNLVSIKFPFGTKKEQAEQYMQKFEDDSYKLVKERENEYKALSTMNKDGGETKEVYMPSGVIYTLSKSDTISTDKKENGNMSKKSEKIKKEAEDKKAPVEEVETKTAEDNVEAEANTEEVSKEETVETAETEETTDTEDSINSLSDDLVAALKSLPTDKVTAILDQVLPSDEDTTAEDSESVASETTEEVVKEEATDSTSEETEEETETAEPSEEIYRDAIIALEDELSKQCEINDQNSQAITELTDLVKSLVESTENLTTKVEKSLSEEDAIEVFKEISSRVDSLEYAPASSEASQVEKSKEVDTGKKSSFLSKYM